MNIRSILYSALAFSIFAFSNVSALETSLGIKGGVNLAKFRGDSLEDQKVKTGLNIGAALQFKVAKMFAIEPEVLFSQKGTKMSQSLEGESYDDAGEPYDGAGESYDVKITVNYIEVPVLLQFLIPIQAVTPMVYVGPSFGFKVGKAKIEINDEKEDISNDEFNAFDFGLVFGGGIGYKAGRSNVVIDVRYTLGLTKLPKLSDEDKDMGMTEDDLPKIKNGALMLGVGYLFTF